MQRYRDGKIRDWDKNSVPLYSGHVYHKGTKILLKYALERVNHEQVNHEQVNHERVNHEQVNHEQVNHEQVNHDKKIKSQIQK